MSCDMVEGEFSDSERKTQLWMGVLPTLGELRQLLNGRDVCGLLASAQLGPAGCCFLYSSSIYYLQNHT